MGLRETTDHYSIFITCSRIFSNSTFASIASSEQVGRTDFDVSVLNSRTSSCTINSSLLPMGRRLEFIVQELGREFNTLTSKSVRPTCSELAIEAKVELEKIREQVLNIE